MSDYDCDEGFRIPVPELLDGKIDASKVYANTTAAGNFSSFGVDLKFEELNLSKTIKSRELDILPSKVQDTINTWETKYRRHLDQQHKATRSDQVDELNREAQAAIEALKNILSHTLDIDDTVDWDSIKRTESFKIKPEEIEKKGQVPEFLKFESDGKPTDFIKDTYNRQPNFGEFWSEIGGLKKLFQRTKMKEAFQEKIDAWKQENKLIDERNATRESVLKKFVSEYEKKQEIFEKQKEKDNQVVEQLKSRYENKDPIAIEEYCDLVLIRSNYPDYFPQNWNLEYRSENKFVVVHYDLPSPALLPTVEHYRYVKSRDEITKKEMTKANQKKLYESVIYQICIRTIHELFEADAVNMVDSVAFNGLVTNTNPATGVEETKIIMSIVANKDEFLTFDLSQVDPKATFKHMKGVAAASLIDLTPIPPIIQLDKSDKRFVEGRNIVGNIDASINLAAMHWDDFEHLIRELFEKEFTADGGEVKVTQASSDGGVDAIAFDADPIRGGKIVIQAKRYTNVVGVAAVRDLYGTVMNEGANKGILVTTSEYGKDSYEFAKDKPLTLINGSHLLSLLEKHGHEARINIAEARKILKE